MLTMRMRIFSISPRALVVLFCSDLAAAFLEKSCGV
jgi:hypothetical protein